MRDVNLVRAIKNGASFRFVLMLGFISFSSLDSWIGIDALTDFLSALMVAVVERSNKRFNNW
jgi:hypothetical protein